jgi:transcription antitermination factor NusG
MKFNLKKLDQYSNKSSLNTIEDKKWYAIYTYFRSEKKVVEYLQHKAVRAYVPLINKVRRYKRKVKKYEVPIINNYVFVHIGKDEFSKVLDTQQVIKFIKIGNEIISIPQHEIDTLRKIEGKDIEIEVGNLNFEIGDEVEITQGNLVGLKGKLTSKLGKKKFTVELDHLGLSLLIDIDINLLSKINSQQRITA